MSLSLLKHDSHTICFKICNFKAGFNPKYIYKLNNSNFHHGKGKRRKTRYCCKKETVKKEHKRSFPQAFPPPISPYDKCMADHIGQFGSCSADGVWTPIS
jgi:hypothetical protein